MKVYLTTGKTAFQGQELTDRQVFYTIWNHGEVYIDPRAVQDGTVSLEDLPRGVTVHFTPEPPEDALVLLPSPRGWRVKS
ncbi:hypothetical protein CSW23_05360 [Thermus scotoductus]|uniref:Uncharacterized protein n=1 Tax=Thermus scotoductus TaxID=37636 RepID=A0A430V4G2_THESC|nr:hypothetical protein [Thermus scotoductus]RTH99809.1 hypothetical protein CSW31_07115 [Thermus scotoductus]RTI18108.1 hypothetical protein CSW23_05360 [Thermus scotoductus]